MESIATKHVKRINMNSEELIEKHRKASNEEREVATISTSLQITEEGLVAL